MLDIVVIAHNIRSTHNVGSIFRTCEGFGVTKLLLTGYSPYPTLPHDRRLPHLATKLSQNIHKTALGTELLVPFEHYEQPPLDELRQTGYRIIGLEQDRRSIRLDSFKTSGKIALLLGEEVSGIEPALREACDVLIEIPMHGHKESFNVSVATGIALYGLTATS